MSRDCNQQPRGQAANQVFHAKSPIHEGKHETGRQAWEGSITDPDRAKSPTNPEFALGSSSAIAEGGMAYEIPDGFTKTYFKDGKWRRPVYRKGSGPAVIIIHEIPGLHPGVFTFANHVAAAGMTVFLPSLFGE